VTVGIASRVWQAVALRIHAVRGQGRCALSISPHPRGSRTSQWSRL